MHDLGLNLDGPKPLKGVFNVPDSGEAASQSGHKFATVLEDRVQSDLSQAEAALKGAEQAIKQPTAKLSWTPPVDEMEALEIMASHPIDPIINTPVDPIKNAETALNPSAPSVEKSANGDAAHLISQKNPAKLTKHTDFTPNFTPQADTTATTKNPLIATPDGDNFTPRSDSGADVNLSVNTSKKRHKAEKNPTEQLSEVNLDPADEPDTAAAAQWPDAPSATPHILESVEPIKASKLITNPKTPPVLADVDRDPVVPDAAQFRVTAEPKIDIVNKPVTLGVDQLNSNSKSGEYLTGTDVKTENESADLLLSLRDLAPKERKSGERQVFSLKINSEIQDTRDPIPSERHIQSELTPKVEQHQNNVVLTRNDAQLSGAVLTPTTLDSIVERNNSLHTTASTAQTGGERLQTFAAAMVLNTRDTQWGQQLVAQIERLSSSGEGKLELSLRPKNLGAMHISLEFNGDETQVRIVTETSAASRVLIGAEDRLAQMLDAAGFKLSTFSTSSDGGLGQGLGQHTRQKQQSAPGSSKNRDAEARANSERSGESHNGTVNVIA